MTDQRGESRKTVLVAISANAAIAAAKGVGGLLSGSSALLAEAAHSAADACNQGLMLLSLHRSERAPDEEHPFGYGKERFFWVLLAAIFIFLAGGIFGIAEGLFRILAGAAEKGGYAVTYGVLGFALLAEGTSFARALRQTRRGAREARLPFAAYIRASKEPAAKTVVSEDAADVAGILIAFAGTAAAQLTGNELWDGVAAVAIGLLLCVVGWALARDAKGLLIGEPARHEERQRLRRTILSTRRRRGRARSAHDVPRAPVAARRRPRRLARRARWCRCRTSRGRDRRGPARGAALRDGGVPRPDEPPFGGVGGVIPDGDGACRDRTGDLRLANLIEAPALVSGW